MKFPKPSKPIHWAFIVAAIPPTLIAIGHTFGGAVAGVMALSAVGGTLAWVVAAINTDL